MAKRDQEPAKIIIEDSPISEGLRQILRGRKSKTKDVEEDFGIKKPQFYRFLKGERGLSQEALDRLATRLGVRVVVGEGTPGRTESSDSVATRPRTAVPNDLPEILTCIESVIDEAFAEFGAPPHENMPSTSSGGQATWRRLEVWLRPRSGDLSDGPGAPLGDLPGEGWLPADCLVNVHSSGAAEPTPGSRLDDLKASVLRRVRQSLGVTTSEAQPVDAEAHEAVPSPSAGPGPAGGPEKPAADRDDLLAAAGRPGGIDGTPDDKKDKEAEMGAPPTPTTRTKPPELKFEPEGSDDEDDDEEYDDEEGGSPTGEKDAPYDDDDEEYDDEEGGSPTGEKDASYDDDEDFPYDDDEAEFENPKELTGVSPELAAELAELRAKRRSKQANKRAPENIPHYRNPGAAPLPEPEPEKPNPYDNYVPTSGRTLAYDKSPKSTDNKAVWSKRINYLMKSVPDGPAKEFAKTYTSKSGGPTVWERDKFFNFVNQMVGNNPDATKILMDPEFGKRYKEIAKAVDDPKNMGLVGNDIQFSYFYPVKENPEGFYGHLNQILRAQGVRYAVKIPEKKGRARPRPASGDRSEGR